MARNLIDLANELEAKIKPLEKAASDHAAKIALTIVADLAYHTPVDTSQALSNWQVTLGTAATGKIKPHFPGSQGSTQKASAQETIDRAKAVLKTKEPGQTIFITNNLRYIRRLNDGYSKQVPAGFVERALLLARKMKNKFALRN